MVDNYKKIAERKTRRSEFLFLTILATVTTLSLWHLSHGDPELMYLLAPGILCALLSFVFMLVNEVV